MFKKGISLKQMRTFNTNRIISGKSFGNSNHVVFLIENFTSSKFRSLTAFTQVLRESYPNCKSILVFIEDEVPYSKTKGDETPKAKHEEFDLDFVYAFSKNDLGFGKSIKSEQLSDLLEQKFDILIAPEELHDDVSKGIHARINSEFKVGVDNDFNEEFCDFCISNSGNEDLSSFLPLVDKQLNQFFSK